MREVTLTIVQMHPRLGDIGENIVTIDSWEEESEDCSSVKVDLDESRKYRRELQIIYCEQQSSFRAKIRQY